MRLIEADALTAELEEAWNACNDVVWSYDGALMERMLGVMNGLAMAVATVKNMPTVDAVPVVYGKWIQGVGSYSMPHCSLCGWTMPYDEHHFFDAQNYCPDCGAKMNERRGKK